MKLLSSWQYCQQPYILGAWGPSLVSRDALTQVWQPVVLRAKVGLSA